jgi:beta-glucosidase
MLTSVDRYNLVNGVFMSENEDILQNVLRKEWGFEGAIVSDFEGVYSTIPSVLAGVALELPGPARFRGDSLLEAVKKDQVLESQIDLLVKDVIRLASKVGKEDDGSPEQNILKDKQTAALVRQMAIEGIVLLRNEGNTLPILPYKNPKIAVFGSPATTPIIHGGGSASLTPSYVISPLEALEKRYGKSNVQYHTGVPIFKKIPSAPLCLMATVSDGKPGVDCYWYNGWTVGTNQVYHEVLEATQTLVIDSRISDLAPTHCSRMSFILRPKTTGIHAFGVTACGESILRVDGDIILKHAGFTDCRVEYVMQPGDYEVRANLEMEADRAYHVTVDTLSTTAPLPSPIFYITPQATRVGFYENLDSPIGEDILQLAAKSEISIIFTANNKEFESESFDRSSMSLSPSQDELIRIVASAAPKSVLVNQTGAPISMPWIEDVDAILQCWYAGQEVGNALADIISGDVSPSGKLPVTFPQRIEDSPSFDNFPTDHEMNIRYEEGLEMGYRARNKPAPLYPFGFGLSYTKFQATELTLKEQSDSLPTNVTLETTVTNAGFVTGREVVQIYVDGVLKGFKGVVLSPGESHIVEVCLDKYAFSRWESSQKSWVVEARDYKIELRQDANTVISSVTHTIGRELFWTGV